MFSWSVRKKKHKSKKKQAKKTDTTTTSTTIAPAAAADTVQRLPEDLSPGNTRLGATTWLSFKEIESKRLLLTLLFSFALCNKFKV